MGTADKKELPIENQRFIGALEEIKINENLKKDSDVLAAIEWDKGRTVISEIKLGRTVPKDLINKLSGKYGLSEAYIRKGELPKFSNKNQSTSATPIDRLVEGIEVLVSEIKADRESTKERFQVIDSNFAKLDSKVKSLSEFDRQTVHRLEQIEGRLAKLIMTDPNSGTAVLGKKRRN